MAGIITCSSAAGALVDVNAYASELMSGRYFTDRLAACKALLCDEIAQLRSRSSDRLVTGSMEFRFREMTAVVLAGIGAWLAGLLAGFGRRNRFFSVPRGTTGTEKRKQNYHTDNAHIRSLLTVMNKATSVIGGLQVRDVLPECGI
ncbi:hypothetical protein RA290_21055 (plasmid) [Pantoea agglomerans]|uniref:hypothetical protein n=1 Tax=Enterobacter agglomerans TaxID=549 RepID=UPI003AB10213